MSVADSFPEPAILTSNGRKARYGPAYVRTICAQAGVKVSETAPDEDVIAVDLEIGFAQGNVGVQVKCTARDFNPGDLVFQVQPDWVAKWRRYLLPLYFVVVVVPGRHDDWMRHDHDGTFHSAIAFWARIRAQEATRSIRLPRHQRLTATTMALWHRDLIADFGPGMSP